MNEIYIPVPYLENAKVNNLVNVILLNLPIVRSLVLETVTKVYGKV